MPPRLARKPLNSYHHGDLRDALVQAALQEAERGGPEAISIKALTKKLGVSQPAPYRHFVDREALLEAVTAEAFRQFSATLRESIRKPSKQSKLSRFAQAALAFGLRRNGIYRLMFASRTMAGAVRGSELHNAAMETFGLLLEAFEAPAIGLFRERQALKIWAALHGMITLAEQGLLTGQLANISREELLEEIVEQTKSALAAAIKTADAASLGLMPSSAHLRVSMDERAPCDLPRRPRIDRRGAPDSQNVLQQLRAGEQLRLAARRRHHLQTDRQA